MRIKTILLILVSMYCSLQALTAEELITKLSINPASKAMMQWERVFKSERKMKKYKINELTDEEKKKLKSYLVAHAADSDTPQFAGDF